MKKFDKKSLIIIIVALLLFLILALLGIYKCPFEYILGIPCPTCGITRAFVSLLHFNITDSFYYYALWPLAVLFFIFIILIQLNILKVNKKTFNIICIILAIIILIYFIIRHINGSEIVQIHFDESLIYKIYNFLIR